MRRGPSAHLFLLSLFLCGTIPAQTDVLTGGYGNDRTNASLSETTLTPATVAGGSFGKLFSLAVDGQVYAQPLYMRGIPIPGRGVRNIVFIATMHNTVYAFDADHAELPLWSVNLGSAVPAAYYDSTDGPYDDIAVENGILGTPVIDAATGTLYVVAATLKNRVSLYRIHALDVTTGEERFGAPSTILAHVPGIGDSSEKGVVSFVAQQHLQRPGLLLLNGAVYVAFGAHGDALPYHGWILAYSASDVHASSGVFNTTPNGSGGSFWQSGRGLSADQSGAIYAVSSNGDTDGSNYSDSVLKLKAADLSLLDWFAPSDVQVLNTTDDDLGSAGAVLIPGTDYLVTGGKAGAVYVLNRSSLGHQASADSTVVPIFQATGFGLFNLALWTRPGGAILYTHGVNETIRAWQFSGDHFNAQPLSESQTLFPIAFQGMTISASGGNNLTGILWVTQPFSYELPEDGHLVAYSAADLSNVLWDSANVPDDAMGGFTKFANPTVVNGKVFVPTTSGTVAVYGLLPQATVIQPVVTAVASAASYEPGAVAPGEIVIIRGDNLGPEPLEIGYFDPFGQLPAQLAGTQVTFNGIAAPLLYTSSVAVAAIVPYEVGEVSSLSVQVLWNGQASVAQTVTLTSALPGVFSSDASGNGPGAILNEDYSLNSPDSPALPGSVAIVYATGGGTSNGAFTGRRADAADSLNAPVTATINGEPAEVLYAGAAPTLVYGAVQVNIRLPPDLSGDLPLVLVIAGHSSPATVTVSIK